jgi:cytochrome b561
LSIGRHAWVAILDTAMLAAFLALMAPGASTGFEWHEWIGVAFIPLFILHVVLSWTWVVGTWRRLWTGTHPRARLNFLLNTSLTVMMVTVIVSGLVVSDYALPAAGIPAAGTDRWRQLHNFTSSLILIVVGLHMAVNWSWIKGAFKRYVIAGFQRERATPNVER